MTKRCQVLSCEYATGRCLLDEWDDDFRPTFSDDMPPWGLVKDCLVLANDSARAPSRE